MRIVEWQHRFDYGAEGRGFKAGPGHRAKPFCKFSRKWLAISNQEKISQRKGRNGSSFHMLCPRCSGLYL